MVSGSLDVDLRTNFVPNMCQNIARKLPNVHSESLEGRHFASYVVKLYILIGNTCNKFPSASMDTIRNAQTRTNLSVLNPWKVLLLFLESFAAPNQQRRRRRSVDVDVDPDVDADVEEEEEEVVVSS